MNRGTKVASPADVMTIYNPDNVQAFTFTLDNSTGTQTKSYRLFDVTGINTAIDGSSRAAADSATAGVTATQNTTYSYPIVVDEFNYQTSSSNTQFSQTFQFVRGSIDGQQIKLPLITQKARRNTQFEDTLLTIKNEVVIDSQTAVDVDVIKSETVTLTFMILGYLA